MFRERLRAFNIERVIISRCSIIQVLKKAEREGGDGEMAFWHGKQRNYNPKIDVDLSSHVFRLEMLAENENFSKNTPPFVSTFPVIVACFIKLKSFFENF